MDTTHEHNQNENQAQALPAKERMKRLRFWKLENGVTFVEMGKHMTALKGSSVTGSAVIKSLEGERMPVANHAALLRAYPDLPVELLPRPENISRTFTLYKQAKPE